MKCDVIIPVYKAPEWVKLCVYALFQNTSPSHLGKVFLINDCDDVFTINCLKNLKSKYQDKITILQNDQNLGFIKTCNRGLSLVESDAVLLLNSDCLLSPRTIEKLLAHLKNDSNIGLICPMASNAANITIPIPEGFSYTDIDKTLEEHFKGQNFDACTVVGNCLMITKKCLDKTGFLDESYGTGYGEETDYQFKAMEQGFTAKVAIDTYVFHKAEASFGTSKEKQARLAKNRDLFFSRWGEQYKTMLKQYEANDPIKYIETHLPRDIFKSPSIKTLFYLDGIVQNAGGVHNVVDIVNYLVINGKSANILYNLNYPYKEIMLFTPIPSSRIETIKVEQIVSTVWKTAFTARSIANAKHAKLLSFIQGYEAYFENGSRYGNVELSYKLSDSLFTISNYLKTELKSIFGEDSTLIPNGINYDLIHTTKKLNLDSPTITIILRDNIMKGDWLLIDIIKRLSITKKPYTINLVSIDPKISLPNFEGKDFSVKILRGPLSRLEVYQLLQKTDIYLDASLSEGFGLTALEAMAAGCIPIVSNSLGVNEYIKNSKNGFVVDNLNDASSYLKVIDGLSKIDINKIQQSAVETASKYDFDRTIHHYINYFNNPPLISSAPKLSSAEKAIIAAMDKDHSRHQTRITAFNIVKKITPKPLKVAAVKIINKLYHYLNK